MNRIVIIGNGFDKAHGLPTAYSDFLDSLKNSIVDIEKGPRGGWKLNPKNGLIHRSKEHAYHLKLPNGQADKWIVSQHQKNGIGNFRLTTNSNERSIYYQSLFNENSLTELWSDLETHYFNSILKNKGSNENVVLINEEFDHLKGLLFDYLKTQVEDEIGEGKALEVFYNNGILDNLRDRQHEYEFKKNYFISFNYTEKIINQHLFWLRDTFDGDSYHSPPIHIHGSLSDPKNPIIFGYGDENIKDYEVLEQLLNDKLLEKFKTFQYLRTNKYRQVLGLLEESDDIFVQIIGHSCGLCDKALLRTIFQHPNVKNIEVVYHKDESKYFEKLYAISRIFDENVLMRKKIIPFDESFMIKSNDAS